MKLPILKWLLMGPMLLSLCSVSCRTSDTVSTPQDAVQPSTLVIKDSCSKESLDKTAPYVVTPKDTGRPFVQNPQYPDKKPYVAKSQQYDVSYKIKGVWARLHMVDIYNLDRHVKATGPSVPASLRGLWWMDGNPVPEVILSFADSQIDQKTGYIRNPYNGVNSYLFSASATGRGVWDITKIFATSMLIRPTPEINLENPKPGDFFYVDVDARVVGYIKSSNLPTTFIEDGLWRRETGDHCYNLRRIVDEKGQKLPVYDYFIGEVLKKNQQAGSKNPDKLLQIRTGI